MAMEDRKDLLSQTHEALTEILRLSTRPSFRNLREGFNTFRLNFGKEALSFPVFLNYWAAWSYRNRRRILVEMEYKP